MDFTTIRYAIDDGIATITLDRPAAMNAFNKAMMADLLAVFDRTDADDAVRAVIMTGAGERAFCAGADLSGGAATFDYAKRTTDGGAWDDSSPFRINGSIDYSHPGARDGGGKVALRIFASRKPVIGAINGAAVGIGATMTLPMDFRLASETARYGFVFARRGITPEAASSWFLPRLVGIGRALEWCYSGEVFGADEALAGGLVRSVHAPADLLPAARALAERLTAQSAPVSIAMTRKLLWAGLASEHPMQAHRRDSRAIWARGRAGDAKEGVTSFLEKRAPTYPDRVSERWDEFAEWFDEPEYK